MFHEICPSNSSSFLWSFLCVLVLPVTYRNTSKASKSNTSNPSTRRKNIVGWPSSAPHTTTRTQSSKSAFTIAFFAAVNHNYDHKQRTLKHRNTKRIEIHQSQITNHDLWTCLSKVLFPNRSAKMIDGSEKRKRQLAFELESSRFFKNAQ